MDILIESTNDLNGATDLGFPLHTPDESHWHLQ
jgi:hypothetical protein